MHVVWIVDGLISTPRSTGTEYFDGASHRYVDYPLTDVSGENKIDSCFPDLALIQGFTNDWSCW